MKLLCLIVLPLAAGLKVDTVDVCVELVPLDHDVARRVGQHTGAKKLLMMPPMMETSVRPVTLIPAPVPEPAIVWPFRSSVIPSAPTMSPLPVQARS